MLWSKAIGAGGTLNREGWNVSTAVLFQNRPISGQDAAQRAIFFRDDGLKLYTVGLNNDRVYEYNLSIAWDILSAVFFQSLLISGQDGLPVGLFFSTDGLKMYMTGLIGNRIYEYDLSTAWDVSTAAYVRLFSPGTRETSPRGVFFRPDGLKMYVIGQSSDAVNEYNLSTAWNTSTAVFLQSFSVSPETAPNAMFFKPDGTKMYVGGGYTDAVREYNLSTAWDVSTTEYVQQFGFGFFDPYGIFFKPDGLKMYMLNNSSDLFEYNLTA